MPFYASFRDLQQELTRSFQSTGQRIQFQEAIAALSRLVRKHGVSHIAIGNGTASRETEQMAVELIQEEKNNGIDLSYMIVSEAGASVYSASPLAAEEFPQYDVNLRSAVSIARRLQDPLAELVKIEPKAIGVGQYQHDMPEKQLDAALNSVVEDCVNAVGVDANTASPSLLLRVSGLTNTIAKNIVAYREEHGAFTDRKQLLKVPKLGPKAYEQCAGFLRISESKNILDNTAVHPESYPAAERLLSLTRHSMEDVRASKLGSLSAEVEKLGRQKVADAIGIGVPTLLDVVAELQKPGRDVRDSLPQPILRTDVLEIKDLKPGMVLAGTVRNVIDFGAFVDIGVHQDGLIHISEIADRYLKHPSEVLSVGDVVQVKILSVDGITREGNTFIAENDNASILLFADPAENSQVVVSFDNLRRVNDAGENIGNFKLKCKKDGKQVEASNQKNNQTIPGIVDYDLNLGYYDYCTGRIRIKFSKAGRYEFDKLYVSAMSTELFDKYAAERCESAYKVTGRESTLVTGTLDAKADGWLFLSIPVNTNWNVYIDDGQVAEIHNANICWRE